MHVNLFHKKIHNMCNEIPEYILNKHSIPWLYVPHMRNFYLFTASFQCRFTHKICNYIHFYLLTTESRLSEKFYECHVLEWNSYARDFRNRRNFLNELGTLMRWKRLNFWDGTGRRKLEKKFYGLNFIKFLIFKGMV